MKMATCIRDIGPAPQRISCCGFDLSTNGHAQTTEQAYQVMLYGIKVPWTRALKPIYHLRGDGRGLLLLRLVSISLLEAVNTHLPTWCRMWIGRVEFCN
jgi:hypothetical protein